jgi:hypothetical protein
LTGDPGAGNVQAGPGGGYHKSLKLKKLGRFFELSGRDRILLIESVVLLSATVCALRTLGFSRTVGIATRQRRLGLPEGDGANLVAPAQAAINRAGRITGVGTCLSKSLALSLLLSRRGVVTVLRIGVDKHSEGMAAHAWLEHAGRPVDPAGARRYDTVFAPAATEAAASR